MATRTSKKKTSSAKRKAVSLTVVIDELQLILDLRSESPRDPRLRQLVLDVKEDFARALKGFPGGDDVPQQKVPLPPG